MKWNKYTIETTTAAEDYLSSALMDLGIEGVQIEDNVPLTKEDQAEMFIDFLPELPPDEGISYVSFYLEDNGQDQDNHRGDAECGRYGNRKDHIRPDGGS